MNLQDIELDRIDFVIIFDVIIIFLLFCNFAENLNFVFICVDLLCSVVLFSDIFKKIRHSENKIRCLFENLILLFTIVPYDFISLYLSFLSNMSILKFLRLLRIILKIFELFRRNKESKLQKVVRQTNTVIVFNVVFTLLFASIVLLCYFESITTGESVYFVMITFSSVGFGDMVAKSFVGRITSILVSILSIFGVGFLSTFCLTYVQFNEEKENEIEELKKQNEKIIKLLEK